MPVGPGKTADQLDADLDEVLSWPPADAAEYMAPVVPTARHDDYLTAESLKIKIGPATPHHVDQLGLADVLAGTRFRPAGTRVQTLRDGYIALYADPDGTEIIGRSAAVNWIEATQSIGPNRYFLLDGTWYKIGETYLESIRQQIQSLIPAQGSEPLSHLFSQALVSVQTLMNSTDARAKLADRVKEQSGGKRQLPQPYTPAKVIFGILLKNGKLTPDTLFPFSQVTLAQAARELQTRYRITVEAIPVEADSA